MSQAEGAPDEGQGAPAHGGGRPHMRRSGLGVLLLNGASTGLGLLASLALTRALGAAGFGVYAFALAWVNLLQVPATLGLDTLLVRNVAAYGTRGEWSSLRGLLRHAGRVVAGTSLLLALLVGLAGAVLLQDRAVEVRVALWVGLSMLPLLALLRLPQAALQGLHHVALGQVPALVVRPLGFLALLGGLYLLLAGDLTPGLALAAHALATGLACLLALWLTLRRLPAAARSAAPTSHGSAWLRSAWPMLLVYGLSQAMAQMGVVFLGVLEGEADTGIFALCLYGARLLNLLMVPVSLPLQAAIAHHFARGDRERLQALTTKSARVMTAMVAPAVILLVLLGDRCLGLFGAEFMRGAPALAILCLGQLAVAALGPTVNLLTMTEHERGAALVLSVSAGLSLVAHVALIPTWGLEGAAVASVASTLCTQVLGVVLVRRRLGLRPTVW